MSTVLKVKRKRLEKKGWRRLLPRRRKEEKCPYIGHRKPFEKHLKEEGGEEKGRKRATGSRKQSGGLSDPGGNS
jgi:hypothetical protein